MRRLIADPELAREIGRAGQRIAAERFDIRRFVRDWEETFDLVIGHERHSGRSPAEELSLAGGVA